MRCQNALPMLRVTCVAAILFLVAACSSSKNDELDDPDLPGRIANPEGVPYPTDHLGGAARTGSGRSLVPGDRIPNFTFQTYVDGNRAAGLVPVSLADYFDPQRLHHKLLHLEVAAVWCEICSSYADATVTAKEPLGQEGVVYLEVMVGGANSATGPSLGDVDDWIGRHNSNFSTAIDEHGRRLQSIGVPPQTMPWDIMIDTRTMEILESSGGAPVDIVAFDRSYLALIEKTGPVSY